MTASDLHSSIHIAADTGNLPRVRDWAATLFRELAPGLPEGEAHAFVLAVHEAACNIIEHAYEGRCGDIEGEARLRSGGVAVVLTHGGRPFHGAAPQPAFDGSRERGLGVFLMSQALTRIDYRHTEDGRQQVELFKATNVKPSAA